MRFEKLSHFEKLAFLTRLHKRLNKNLFNNELHSVFVDIQNLDSCYGMYCRNPERILFSHEMIEQVKQCRTQKDQIYIITLILLHEMIHQYCTLKGIEDKDHPIQWQEEAEKHGLHSIYKAGELQEEYLTYRAEITIYGLRIK